jgi:phosphinothricin acetyltransferase
MTGQTPLIAPAREAHLAAITAIYNQAVRETFSIWSEVETTIDLRRAWLNIRLASGFPVLVAVEPGAPDAVLGYGSYGHFRDFPGYAGTVEHSVYVRPGVQRRGVGRALLIALMENARASGLSAMVGGIDSANTASLALHRSLGFEEQGRLKGVGRKFGQSQDLVFMVKSI